MRKLMCLAAAICLLTSMVSGCRHVAGKCDCCDQGCTSCAHGGSAAAPVETIQVKPMPK